MSCLPEPQPQAPGSGTPQVCSPDLAPPAPTEALPPHAVSTADLASVSLSAQEWSLLGDNVLELPKLSVLDLCMNASEAPIVDDLDSGFADADMSSWVIEDPDLMPTLEDWLLVQKQSRIFFAYDGDEFLNGFFTQPAAWRLIHCATNAYMKKLPEDIQLSYFKRAHKAVIHSMNETASYKSVQTLYFLSTFAEWKGQPEASKPFLKKALDLIQKLRLDIDPDYSPWLYHLNLSARQREDRRRAFWSCFLQMRFHQAISSDATLSSITADNIKSPSAVNFPHPIFTAMPQLKWMCEIYNILGLIKRHHLTAPISTGDLMKPTTISDLHSYIQLFLTHVPAEYLLVSETAYLLTEMDSNRFRSQIDHMHPREQTFVLTFNAEIMSAQCALHRPTMYLSSIKSCRPIYLSEQHQNLIASSIQQCLENALRISHLLPKLLELNMFNSFMVLCPFFEAMNVFWFIRTRMDKIWWGVLKATSKIGIPSSPPSSLSSATMIGKNSLNWAILHPICLQIVNLVRNVHSLEGSKSGSTLPLLQCVEAMLHEMENIEDRSLIQNSIQCNSNCEKAIESAVFEMKILALDEDVVVEELSESSSTKEPPCFLGLLGMEVGPLRSMRWKGPSEESWRLFWKLYC
ncbi:hypothetical protein BDR26DRAFT_937640 [Obelidium mucronatum]|nr:hypothetical protein BDR26DRAFT_937640 [Obelidium mucronatum]